MSRPRRTVSVPLGFSGCWGWAATRQPGRSYTSCGERWFDPVEIVCMGWSRSTKPTGVAKKRVWQVVHIGIAAGTTRHCPAFSSTDILSMMPRNFDSLLSAILASLKTIKLMLLPHIMFDKIVHPFVVKPFPLINTVHRYGRCYPPAPLSWHFGKEWVFCHKFLYVTNLFRR